MIATLEARSDFAPVPRVEIRVEDAISWDGGDPDATGPDEFDGGTPDTDSSGFDAGTPFTIVVALPAGTDSFTVWRTAAGRRMKVRGAVARSYSGALGLQDMEAPFGVPATYDVECYQDGVLLETVVLGTVTLPLLGDRWLTLIQQPLNPHLWALVEELDVNANEVTRAANGDLVLPENTAYPSMIGYGPRQGLSGVALSLLAPTREAAARVWATLGSESDPQLQAWLIRSTHPLLPPVFFCDARSVQERGLDLSVGGVQSVFSATVTEIAPPAPGLAVAALSYDDLDVSFESYDAMDAEFSDYNDKDTAWQYAGAAG